MNGRGVVKLLKSSAFHNGVCSGLLWTNVWKRQMNGFIVHKVQGAGWSVEL